MKKTDIKLTVCPEGWSYKDLIFKSPKRYMAQKTDIAILKEQNDWLGSVALVGLCVPLSKKALSEWKDANAFAVAICDSLIEDLDLTVDEIFILGEQLDVLIRKELPRFTEDPDFLGETTG